MIIEKNLLSGTTDNTRSSLKVASLFAGVGGIDTGFELSGKYDVIYANEFDTYAASTYEANSAITVDKRSICDVRPEDIPDVDVIVAGPPCQDLSQAGRQAGLKNPDGTFTRSGLIYEAIRIVRAKKPRVALFENVKNLRAHDHGRTMAAVLDELRSAGYPYVKSAVLNASSHGNIPQNRERIFIAAFRDKTDFARFDFPEATPLRTSISDIVDTHVKVHEKYYRMNGRIIEAATIAMDDPTTVYQWRRNYIRKNMSHVCPTLTANMGEGGNNVPLVLTDHGIRKLTPAECFAFQGFPDDFKFPANMSNTNLYKQAGNSVCVPVVRRIAEKISEALQ